MLSINQDIVLFCAFRYALPRRTYVVDTVASEITRQLPYIATKTLVLMRNEITLELVSDKTELSLDIKTWTLCRKHINKELWVRSNYPKPKA